MENSPVRVVVGEYDSCAEADPFRISNYSEAFQSLINFRKSVESSV